MGRSRLRNAGSALKRAKDGLSKAKGTGPGAALVIEGCTHGDDARMRNERNIHKVGRKDVG